MSQIGFKPDLVVEITQVCDRKCMGCYAPNVVSALDAAALLEKSPELFLDIKNLSFALQLVGAPVGTISVRGGEPSRHPRMLNILKVLKPHAETLVLETHGRWILNFEKGESEKSQVQSVLDTLSRLGVVVKISFDRMHGLSDEKLVRMTQILNHFATPWKVAVTEADLSDFYALRARFADFDEDRWIFQKKATSLAGMIRPSIGVIDSTGKFRATPTVKASFLNQETETA